MNIEISPKEYEKLLNWYDAMMYCQLMMIDDKTDWRLPTKEDLNYIYNSENDFENDFVRSSYWTPMEHDSDSAWIHAMNSGIQGYNFNKNYLAYVRPVRTIEPF
jgi:hypothetical protein